MKGRGVEWLAAAALLGCFAITVSQARADEKRGDDEHMTDGAICAVSTATRYLPIAIFPAN